MDADFFSFICQVVGVDAYAMAPDESRLKGKEIPFGSGRFKNCFRGYVHAVENHLEFIHESDIYVALGVFNNFGSLGDLDALCPVDPGFDSRAVDFSNHIKGFRSIAGNDFRDTGKGVHLVAGIDALR